MLWYEILPPPTVFYARENWMAKASSFEKTLVVRSHIGWRGERNIIYKGVETSPSQTCFKPCGEARKEKPKKTISSSGGLGLLQMVSEPDTGQCASENASGH